MTRSTIAVAALCGLFALAATDVRAAKPAPPPSARSAAAIRELAALPPGERRARLDAMIAKDPLDTGLRALRAAMLESDGEVAAALADIDAALASEPSDGRTREAFLVMRGAALLQLARPGEAVRAASQALELAPKDEDALFTRGGAYLQLGQGAQAVADLDAFVHLAPEQADGHHALALGLGMLGQHAGARDEFVRALELAPDDAGTHEDYARSLSVLGDVTHALSEADAAIRLAPSATSARMLRLLLLGALERFDDVVAEATGIVDGGAKGQDLSMALQQRAQARIWMLDVKSALADLDRLAAIDDGVAAVHGLRGRADMLREDWAGAVKDYDRAIALGANDEITFSGRGLALAKLGRRDAAMADMARAVALDPGDVFARRHFAQACHDLGDTACEAEQLRTIVRVAPRNPIGWLGLGGMFEAQGDPAAAIAILTQAIDGGLSDSGELHAGRAEVRFRSGDFPGAVADYRRAVALKPDDAAVWSDLGVALQRQGDAAQSVAAYRAALALRPDAATSAKLGGLLFFEGRFGEAIEPLRAGLASADADPYLPIRLFLARVRADAASEAAARTELAGRAAAHVPRGWTDALADALLGRIDAAALDREARSGPPSGIDGRRCEGDFYRAELLLAHADASAWPLLDEARRLCPPNFVETTGTAREFRLRDGRGGTP